MWHNAQRQNLAAITYYAKNENKNRKKNVEVKKWTVSLTHILQCPCTQKSANILYLTYKGVSQALLIQQYILSNVDITSFYQLNKYDNHLSSQYEKYCENV